MPRAAAGEIANISLRVPRDTHIAVTIAAAQSDKSMNQWVIDIIEQASAVALTLNFLIELEGRQIVTGGDVSTALREELSENLARMVEFAWGRNVEASAYNGIKTKLRGIVESMISAEGEPK